MLYSLIEFLASPMGFLFLVSIVFVLPLCLIAHAASRRFAVLRQHFQGRYSWIGGIRIDFSDRKFHFSATGRSRGSVEHGGIASSPVLWGYIESPATFLCAKSDITKYEFDWNLGASVYRKNITVAGVELLIGSDSEVFLKKIEKNMLGDAVLAGEFAIMFERIGSHLVGRQETHIGHKSVVSREKVFRYSGFQETVYHDPSILEHRMRIILDIFEKLDVVLERCEQ